MNPITKTQTGDPEAPEIVTPRHEADGGARKSFGAAGGSPALTWHEHPTRAGWWVRWMRHSGGTLEALLVEQVSSGKLVIRNGSLYEPAETWPGRWAGPVEPQSASPAETPG